MGKYIRHALAALIGAGLAAVIPATGVETDPDQVQGIADGIAAGLEPLIMLVGYAWSEKFMKRFKTLDPEGAADREAIKVEAIQRGYIEK